MPQSPGAVVIGIIDDGIAFAHDRFRKSDGTTRVEYVWLQDGVYDAPVWWFDYGRELRKQDADPAKSITDLLNNCSHGGSVDEDELYQRAGSVDYRRAGHKTVAWRVAHGTHVMDLACGFDPQENRDDRPIICVQLPAMTTADTSGASLTPYAVDAMRYILKRADDIAQARGETRLPVVINFSYGLIAGPHDGTSEIEHLIDKYVADRTDGAGQRWLEVVLPSGNSHLSRCHAEISFHSIGQAVPLHWCVQPDDQTPSFLEIWLPCRSGGGTASRLKLTIKPPKGTESPDSLGEEPGQALQWAPNGRVLCEAKYKYFPAPTERGMFLVALQPTASSDPAMPLAPSGTWTIRLENESLSASEVVHAWIQRDETLYGHPRGGRQSYFDHECYKRFDEGGREIEEDYAGCLVRRAGLVNAIATGRQPVVMGGFLRRDMVAAKYSAGGPVTARCGTGAPDPFRPDALAVSDDSRVHGGVLAAGARSGSVVAMNGTSVATPQITRWIAERLAMRNPAIRGDRHAVRGEAAYQEGAMPTRSPIPPTQSARYGAGRIELPPIVDLQRYWK
jgi:hypothetical protein